MRRAVRGPWHPRVERGSVLLAGRCWKQRESESWPAGCMYVRSTVTGLQTAVQTDTTPGRYDGWWGEAVHTVFFQTSSRAAFKLAAVLDIAKAMRGSCAA